MIDPLAPHPGGETRAARESRPLRLFLVAGEHSGDALGGKLMAALKARLGGGVMFAGVGGAEMAAQDLASLFPIEDVAVMGPLNILWALPRLISRVYETVGAALVFAPDAVVIIDSPEFTHPIARRIRGRLPEVPIIDYVSPSVWAWRSGRARKMRAYIDEVLALLPFEPAAHERLGGPHCTYVGHPLIEKLGDIREADAAALAVRLGVPAGQEVLLVLPGSRRSEVERLLGVFGETVAELAARGRDFTCIVPAVDHVREKIAATALSWPVKTHVVAGGDKYAAMRLARAALAASGTVTLELALAGLPMAVAYKVDRMTAPIVRWLVKTETVVLPNLVLGDKAFPEFLQEDCRAEELANALVSILDETSQRAAQTAALARVPEKLQLARGTPSEAAAEAVLAVLARRSRSQLAGHEAGPRV